MIPLEWGGPDPGRAVKDFVTFHRTDSTPSKYWQLNRPGRIQGSYKTFVGGMPVLYGDKDRPTEMWSHLESKLLNGVLIIHVCESLTIQLQPPHDALRPLDLDLFNRNYFTSGGITSHNRWSE